MNMVVSGTWYMQQPFESKACSLRLSTESEQPLRTSMPLLIRIIQMISPGLLLLKSFIHSCSLTSKAEPYALIAICCGPSNFTPFAFSDSWTKSINMFWFLAFLDAELLGEASLLLFYGSGFLRSIWLLLMVTVLPWPTSTSMHGLWSDCRVTSPPFSLGSNVIPGTFIYRDSSYRFEAILIFVLIPVVFWVVLQARIASYIVKKIPSIWAFVMSLSTMTRCSFIKCVGTITGGAS